MADAISSRPIDVIVQGMLTTNSLLDLADRFGSAPEANLYRDVARDLWETICTVHGHSTLSPEEWSRAGVGWANLVQRLRDAGLI